MSRSARRVALSATALSAMALLGAAAVARTLRPRLLAQARVLPELRHPLLLLPLPLNHRPAMRLFRALPMRPTRVADGVALERRTLPGRGTHPPVGVYVYDTADRPRPSGAVLWIHGGGFVVGHPATYHDVCSRLALELGAVVVSVDYRLAPEHPFPAGLEDCYTALRWIHDHAGELGVDPRRIAVAGDSAGGGLAATLAQLAHDRGEVAVCFQALVYPMLDDRTVLRTDHAGTGTFVWTPELNRFGWTAYLGHPPADGAESPYAAAARRAELGALPPAWIGVGDLDLFHAEDLAYAERLTAAGVPCQVYEVAGMYHGADTLLAVTSPAMAAFRSSAIEALRGALCVT